MSIRAPDQSATGGSASNAGHSCIPWRHCGERNTAARLPEVDCPTLTVAMDAAAEITAVTHEQFPSEQTFLLTAGDDTITVDQIRYSVGPNYQSMTVVEAAA